jgi:hypothetical protein
VSGGSYNYLHCALDLEDLQARQHDLQDMAKRLASFGYAQDAARETEELLLLLRQWQTRAEVRITRLRDLWKAVEWWDSNDSSETRVHEALAKYRGDTDGTPAP